MRPNNALDRTAYRRRYAALRFTGAAAQRERWASETERQREGRMKQIAGLLFGLLALLIVESPAAQSNYPEKSIRLVVGFPPGSSVDIVARLLGQRLTEALGKPLVVENLAGAAGNIAAERVARAVPDGYTLALAANAQIIINPSLYKLSFDPVKDFAPVSQVYVSPNILVVHNAVTAKSVQ